MPIQLLQQAAAANEWLAITPELMLALLALLLLVLELVLPRRLHTLIPATAIVAQIVIALGLAFNFDSAFTGPGTAFNGLLRLTADGQFLRLFFLVCSIFVCLLGTVCLAKQRMPRVEFYHLVLIITAAMMLLAQSNHFVLFFVALETVTVGFYILVSYFRESPLSLEAGLKYLVMGALSSSILLFGIVLLYGAAGNQTLPGGSPNSMNFDQLRIFLTDNPGNFLASAGIVLVLAGVAFKIGAVPFQIWIPDVYQGAPTPVTAFLAVASKAAGFAVLLILTQRVFAPYQGLVIPVLSVMAAATILFGNLAALTQHNVKRLIGLSGVSHAGYLMIGVIAAYREPHAIGAIWFYLSAYLLASFAVFGVMAHVAGPNDADQELDHYADLARDQPFLAAVLAIGLGSLAGIPPLAGFMGKLLIFVAAFKAGLYPLLAVAIAGVVISIYYYFGWIKAAFFPAWRPTDAGLPQAAVPARTPVGLGVRIALTVLAVTSVLLGFYQGAFGQWILTR
jgi:NADH-quinone oxidoreductase subunit N